MVEPSSFNSGINSDFGRYFTNPNQGLHLNENANIVHDFNFFPREDSFSVNGTDSQLGQQAVDNAWFDNGAIKLPDRRYSRLLNHFQRLSQLRNSRISKRELKTLPLPSDDVNNKTRVEPQEENTKESLDYLLSQLKKAHISIGAHRKNKKIQDFPSKTSVSHSVITQEPQEQDGLSSVLLNALKKLDEHKLSLSDQQFLQVKNMINESNGISDLQSKLLAMPKDDHRMKFFIPRFIKTLRQIQNSNQGTEKQIDKQALKRSVAKYAKYIQKIDLAKDKGKAPFSSYSEFEDYKNSLKQMNQIFSEHDEALKDHVDIKKVKKYLQNVEKVEAAFNDIQGKLVPTLKQVLGTLNRDEDKVAVSKLLSNLENKSNIESETQLYIINAILPLIKI